MAVKELVKGERIVRARQKEVRDLYLGETAAHEALYRDALMDLFVATAGWSWSQRDDWSSMTSAPCSWFGVACSSGTVAGVDVVGVVQLALSGNGLSGTLPDSISMLPLAT